MLLPRLKRTSALRYTVQNPAKSKLLPPPLETLTLAPLSSGDGGKEKGEGKIPATTVVKKGRTNWCGELYLCRQ